MAAPYSIIDRFIVGTDSGETIPGASVYVTLPGGAPATLYAKRDGTATIDYPSGLMSNPLTADSDGRITCYVNPGRYNIQSTSPAGAVNYYDVIVPPEDFLRIGDIAGDIVTIDTFPDFANTAIPLGDIALMKGKSTAGQRGDLFISKSGVKVTEPGSVINSNNIGLYFQKLVLGNEQDSNITQTTAPNSLSFNIAGRNYDQNIMLFGDSHGWGQGAPQWDVYGVALDYSTHSASIFNKGFMYRISEHIRNKCAFNEKLYTINAAGVASLRILPSDSMAASSSSDYLCEPMRVMSGRVLGASNLYTPAVSSYKGWFTPFATNDTALIDYYRDKIFKGRFNKGAFNIYPETEANFLECGKQEYISLTPTPGFSAAGGYTAITDSNGNVLGQYNGASFRININVKTPYTDVGFFSAAGQALFIPGYGKFVFTAGNIVTVGSESILEIQVKAADGTSYPTGLEKYIFANMRIYRDEYIKNTCVVAEPKEAFRKIYIGIRKQPAGRKISIFLKNDSSLGALDWNPNGHLSAATTASYKPMWDWGQSGFPVVNLVTTTGARASATSSGGVLISGIHGGYAIEIDTYAASAADIVYEIDFGSKVDSTVYIEDRGNGSGGTSLFSTVRGIIFDNNSVTNWSMGGHTIGNWLGIGASYNDAAHDHIGDIINYTKATPSLVVTQLPIVNEYLRQTSINDFQTNIATFMSRLNAALNPGATKKTDFLFFTSVGSMDIEFGGSASAAIGYQDYVNAALETCLTYSAAFVDCRQMLRDMVANGQIDYHLLYNDNIHPNAFANELIGAKVCQFVDAMIG